MLNTYMKNILIIFLCLIFFCLIRDTWINGIVIERKARQLSNFLDQSFARLGLGPENLTRHFYEERKVGIKKFVYTTRIFKLPDNISSDRFYHAILDAVRNSRVQLLEKTIFDIDNYSVSVFVLGYSSLSTHLIIGVKETIPKEDKKEKDVSVERSKPEEIISKVAIIIDDLGYNKKIFEYIEKINVPLTLSVLPDLPFSREIAAKGHDLGYEIMLHLPLEPNEDIAALGPGAIFLDMAPDEMERILEEDLSTVPYCRGINNHTGSRFTADTEKMAVLLNILKRKGLFFIDSLVTPESKGVKLARALGIPSASRDVFLDNIKEEEYILSQLNSLIEISKRRGQAIGICHPSTVTLEVLKKNLPLFQDVVKFVYVSELLR